MSAGADAPRPGARRFLWPLAGFVLLLAVLIGGLLHLPEKGLIPSPLIGKPAPNFTLPDLLHPNHPVTRQALLGHWSLVNLWGTWCYVCRDEHATLLKIRQQGLVPIIGIDWNDTDAAALAWLGRLGNPYQRVAEDPSGKVAVDWGVYGAPESFLVNPKGIIVYKQIGELTPEIWFKEFLPRVEAGTHPAGGA